MALEVTGPNDRHDEVVSGAAARRRIDPTFKPRAGPGRPTPGSAESKQRETHWKNTMWNKVQDAAAARDPVDKNGQIDTGAQRCTADTKAGGWCKAHTRYGCLCWVHRAQLNGTQIKSSTIPGAGKGLFARWDFNKGDAIVRYTGDIVQTADGANDGGWQGSSYVLEVTDSWAIDAARTNTADGRMINDTVTTNKRPNVKFAFDARRKVVTIRALKAIKAGEELFISYGREYWARGLEAGNAPQRKQNKRQATATGTKDDPITLDSLARRVFHCSMLGMRSNEPRRAAAATSSAVASPPAATAVAASAAAPSAAISSNESAAAASAAVASTPSAAAPATAATAAASPSPSSPHAGALRSNEPRRALGGDDDERHAATTSAADSTNESVAAAAEAAVAVAAASTDGSAAATANPEPTVFMSRRTGMGQAVRSQRHKRRRRAKAAGTRRVNASRWVGAAQIVTV